MRINRTGGREFLSAREEPAVCVGYFGFERELRAVGRTPLTFHIVQGFSAHASDHLAYLVLPFFTRKRNVEAMLVDVGDIRDGRAERTEDRSQVEDVRLGNADALRHAAGKGRAIAAEGEERAFLWPPVNPAQDLSQSIRHHLERGAGNIKCGLLDALAEWLCDMLRDNFSCAFRVELA